MQDETHIAIFKGRAIRRKFVEDKWFFSVVDIVGALTDSQNPRDYWYKMKIREKESSDIELSTFCLQLKLKSGDGKEYETDCADTEGIFRIIQSIPRYQKVYKQIGFNNNMMFSRDNPAECLTSYFKSPVSSKEHAGFYILGGFK
jgi:hypothetical protein